MILKRLLIMMVILPMVVPGSTYAQSKTVFSGVPLVKISEGGISRVPEELPREISVNLGCLISELEGRYYWATRNNKELIRHDSDNFLTFVAIDGSGYVRIIKKEKKRLVSSFDITEDKYDYVEHMLLGLENITYFGTRN